jgi:hypothetical protein
MAVRQAAEDVRDLDPGEHLVLFGFRLSALGRADCPMLRRTFCGLVGQEGDAALGHLLVLTRVIGAAGRRKVRLFMPGCCGLTDDERCVLGVVAAAQASLHDGDEDDLRARLGDLLGLPASEACLMAAQGVAATLCVCGLDLPARERSSPSGSGLSPSPAGPSPFATLH